jgi:hypothetical protein
MTDKTFAMAADTYVAEHPAVKLIAIDTLHAEQLPS